MYNNKFKTSHLLINNNSFLSPGDLQKKKNPKKKQTLYINLNVL